MVQFGRVGILLTIILAIILTIILTIILPIILTRDVSICPSGVSFCCLTNDVVLWRSQAPNVCSDFTHSLVTNQAPRSDKCAIDSAIFGKSAPM
jgi:hypothetical protein